jgi:hemerythrin-like metal-binding protein
MAYELRMPELNAEHRALFKMAETLDLAVAAGEDSSRVNAMLREFIACAADHFSHEERLMRDTGCPSYAWHKLQHETATARVANLERRSERGDRDAIPLVLEFLGDFMKGHIGLSDRMMVAYLQNHQRALAARVA